MSDVSIPTAQRVKHWREIRNLSQLELAERAGFDNTKLCRIESGATKARADDVEKIAAGLGLTMAEFYGAFEGAKAS